MAMLASRIVPLSPQGLPKRSLHPASPNTMRSPAAACGGEGQQRGLPGRQAEIVV